MTDFLARMGGFVEKLRSSPMPLPTVSEIAHDRCLPSGVAGREIVKDNGYFTVWLNELFLAEGRNWWATYDPVAIVITEFGYGTGRVSVPIVVGPNLISAKNPGVPHGIVLRDTCVAGPYPFRGGNVAITVILYKVKHQDYARGLLRFVESLSSAIGTPADIGMLAKVGGTVLDGLESLLNLGDTVPVAGHRIEIDTSTVSGFVSSYTALIAERDVDMSQLRVEERRLLLQQSDGETARFEKADYVLYSVLGRERRGDESTLPFYHSFLQARNAAMVNNPDNWKRAKAMLLAIYEQMVLSPDLTLRQADALFDSYREDLLAIRKRAQAVHAMPLGQQPPRPDARETRMNNATSVLDLEPT